MHGLATRRMQAVKKKRVSGEQQAMLPEEKKISRTPLPPVTTLEPYRVAPGSPYSAIRLGFNRTLDLHFAREKIEHTPTETPVLPTITPTPPVVPPTPTGVPLPTATTSPPTQTGGGGGLAPAPTPPGTPIPILASTPAPTGTTTPAATPDLCIVHTGRSCEQHRLFFPYQRKA